MTQLGDALDRSDLQRMQAFHAFGLGASGLAIAISIVLGGDPLARHLLWAGAAMFGLANVINLWCARDPKRWASPWRALHWPIAGLGLVPIVYFFGPFSAAAIVFVLGVVFTALGASRRLADGVLAFAIVWHLALAVPVIAGWMDDVGIVSGHSGTPRQLAISEGLVIMLFASSYGLGRWARQAASAALSELADAKRVIGDQREALAEVNADVEAARRINTGRWTGQMLGGRWRLKLVIGRGAMGEVYEAIGADGTEAAVKVLTAAGDSRPSSVDRFHREIQISANLKSAHIVRVLDVAAPDAEVPYLVMERLNGIDLATMLRTKIRITLLELLPIIDQVARGLDVAHSAGVVHRDLKPHNVFCHDSSTWKILDFGVARVAGSSGTLTGDSVVGTPQYMAPEQAAGREVDHAADVYALGAIAYRCLTGRAPFTHRDLAALVYQVVNVPPARPSALVRVPANVEDILAIAMAKDPARRFGSALELARHLSAARDGRGSAMSVPDNAWE